MYDTRNAVREVVRRFVEGIQTEHHTIVSEENREAVIKSLANPTENPIHLRIVGVETGECETELLMGVPLCAMDLSGGCFPGFG